MYVFFKLINSIAGPVPDMFTLCKTFFYRRIMALQRLKAKVCIITGSSSGLGRAIALAYSREGATVVCADLQPAARAEIASESQLETDEAIRQQNGKAIFVKTDVSKSEDFEHLVATTVAHYGRLDV